jgi:hypothetical protein
VNDYALAIDLDRLAAAMVIDHGAYCHRLERDVVVAAPKDLRRPDPPKLVRDCGRLARGCRRPRAGRVRARGFHAREGRPR